MAPSYWFNYNEKRFEARTRTVHARVLVEQNESNEMIINTLTVAAVKIIIQYLLIKQRFQLIRLTLI